METMASNALKQTFQGRRVLVTGHTGFKGSWLSLWLTRLGAAVGGLALAPATDPNHFGLLDLPMVSLLGDIGEPEAVANAFHRLRPEIVFHLAAQPLVRRSYREPVETFAANVMGTVHILEACRNCPDTRAVVVVTSDKCYANQEWAWGYREVDPLGGHDPYSASKAAAEVVAASYRAAFFDGHGPLLATARGGNVIGGGDWSEDRLLPDLVRAMAAGRPLEIRSPTALRPWQHVLDCLHGYLVLAAGLAGGDRRLADAWNFGPAPSANATVSDILDKAARLWPALRWSTTPAPQPHEAGLLCLDSAKAQAILGWRPVWNLDESLTRTISWYRDFQQSGRVASVAQLDDFMAAAEARP